MADKEIQFRKKRETGEIINDTFEFLKQEYKPLSKLLAVYVLPFIVLYAYVQVLVQMKITGSVDLSNPDDIISKIGPIYFHLFLSMMFSLFVQSLLVGTFYSYVEVYVKKGKNNFGTDDITPLLFSNCLMALGASLAVFVIFFAGFILCFLPGIYFANSFSLVFIIIIFEKKGLGNALSRSWQLVRSQWWNTFLINILGIMVVMLISFLISIPSMITGVSTSLLSLKESGSLDYPGWYWVLIGVSTAVTTLFYIVLYTFLAFQYFNLDERTKPVLPPVQDSVDS